MSDDPVLLAVANSHSSSYRLKLRLHCETFRHASPMTVLLASSYTEGEVTVRATLMPIVYVGLTLHLVQRMRHVSLTVNPMMGLRTQHRLFKPAPVYDF